MTNNTDNEMLTLSLSRVIQAPIEKVFNAWLNPQMLAKFMIPAAGMASPIVSLDAQQGGEFSILMQVGDQQLPHGGKYLTIDPVSRIVFTWESGHSIDGSQVTLDFSKKDEATLVELTQVKFYDEAARSAHQGGWGSILEHLQQVLVMAPSHS